MYTEKNFKTKKAVKEAIAAGEQIKVYQPGPFGTGTETGTQTVYLEGPHFPQAHKWYAKGQLTDGILTKIS